MKNGLATFWAIFSPTHLVTLGSTQLLIKQGFFIISNALLRFSLECKVVSGHKSVTFSTLSIAISHCKIRLERGMFSYLQ
jgi:hypothetical protein